MRRLLSFIFASAMVIAAGYVLYMQASHSDVIKGEWLYGAGVFGTIGVIWLWVDFIAPLLGQTKDTDDA